MTSLTLAFQPVVDRRAHWLRLENDHSLANFYCAALWIAVAVIAGRLAARRHRLGWVKRGCTRRRGGDWRDVDVKDVISPAGPSLWILIVAPLAVPLLTIAVGTLIIEFKSAPQRILLGLAGVFVVAGLWLDSRSADHVAIPIAEEGSELMAATTLFALFVSLRGVIPLLSPLVLWPCVSVIMVGTIVGTGVLVTREYWTPVSSATVHYGNIDHGPLSAVSQRVTINRSNLARIDVWAETAAARLTSGCGSGSQISRRFA